jgi:hypothetical protein
MDNQEIPVLDMNEMVEYIQDHLARKGLAASEDAIYAVLDAEEQFMHEKGLIVYDEG